LRNVQLERGRGRIARKKQSRNRSCAKEEEPGPQQKKEEVGRGKKKRKRNFAHSPTKKKPSINLPPPSKATSTQHELAKPRCTGFHSLLFAPGYGIRLGGERNDEKTKTK
jgi:hypothetical protein